MSLIRARCRWISVASNSHLVGSEDSLPRICASWKVRYFDRFLMLTALMTAPRSPCYQCLSFTVMFWKAKSGGVTDIQGSALCRTPFKRLIFLVLCSFLGHTATLKDDFTDMFLKDKDFCTKQTSLLWRRTTQDTSLASQSLKYSNFRYALGCAALWRPWMHYVS